MNWVGSRLPAGAHAEYAGGAGVAGARICSGPGQEARGRAVGSLCLSWEGAGRSHRCRQVLQVSPEEGGIRVPPHHARSVINTESVIIPVIMVQRETAGGNNSAPFVLTETSPL